MNSDLESITHFAQHNLTNDRFNEKALGEDNQSHSGVDLFPRALWDECAQQNILGWATPTNYDGAGFSVEQTSHRLEALGYGCNDNGLLLAIGIQLWGIQQAILRFGSTEQKEQILKSLSKGKLIGAHAINEPGSGSDALNLSTQAHANEGGYLLNGEKSFIALAPVANFSILYASTNQAHGSWGISAFIVDAETDGFTVQSTEPMMGLSSAPLGRISLKDCYVPRSALLGKEGAGASIFNYVQLWERSLLLAPQLGTMKRQLEQCIQFAKSQQRNNVPISKNQSVSHRIANMAVRLNTCKTLLTNAAQKLDADQQDAYSASMVKIQMSEAFEQNSRDAMTLFGAQAYSPSLEHERNLRDSIGSSIYGGTNDLQRVVISSLLGL